MASSRLAVEIVGSSSELQAAAARAAESLKGLGDAVARQSEITTKAGDSTMRVNEGVAKSFQMVAKEVGIAADRTAVAAERQGAATRLASGQTITAFERQGAVALGTADKQVAASDRMVAALEKEAEAARVGAAQQVRANDLAAQSAVRRAQHDEQAANRSKSAFGSSSSSITRAGKAISLGLVGAAAASLDLAVKFQANTTRLQTQAGATASQVDKLRKGMLAMAAEVGFTPNQLANGMYHVVSSMNAVLPASKRVSGELHILKVAAEGAQVGHSNLEETTYALASAMNAMHDPASAATKDMGQLNAIVGAGDMTMQDLIDSFKSGLVPSARNAGLSLQSLGAALAVMGDMGMRGALAGTRLRMSIALLSSPSEAAAKILQTLGMSAHEATSTSSAMADALQKAGLRTTTLSADLRQPNGIMVALKDLNDHLQASGLTATGAAAVMSKAFGGGKMGATITLLAQNTDRLNLKFNQIGQTSNQFGADWQKTSQTTAVSLKKVEGGALALGTSIGSHLLPAVNTGIRDFSGLVHWFERGNFAAHALEVTVGTLATVAIGSYLVSKLTAAIKLMREFGQVLVSPLASLRAMGAASAPTLLGGGARGGAASVLTGGMGIGGARSGMGLPGSLANPLVTVQEAGEYAGMGSMGAAGTVTSEAKAKSALTNVAAGGGPATSVLTRREMTAEETALAAGVAGKQAAGMGAGAAAAEGGLLASLKSGLTTAFEGALKGAGIAGIGVLASQLAGGAVGGKGGKKVAEIGSLTAAGAGVGTMIEPGLGTAVGTGVGLTAGLLKDVKAARTPIIGGLAGGAIGGPIGGAAGLAAGLIFGPKPFESAGKAVAGAAADVWKTVSKDAAVAGKAVAGAFSDAFAEVKRVLGTIGHAVSTAAGAIGGFFSHVGEQIAKSPVGQAAKHLGQALADDFNAIKARLAPIVSAIASVISSVFTTAFNLLGGHGEVFGVKLGGVFHTLASVISGAVSTIKTVVGSVFSWLVGAFDAVFVKTGILKTAFVVVEKVVSTAIRGIEGVVGGMLNVLAGIFEVIAGVIGGKWGKAWKGIKEIVNGTIQAVIGTVRSVAAPIIGVFEGLAAPVIHAISSMISTVGGTISSIVGTVTGAFGTVMSFLEGLPGKFATIGGSIGGGLVSGLGSIGSALLGVLKTAINDGIIGPLNWVIGKINGLHVHILGTDIGVPHIGPVAKLAAGGLVPGPANRDGTMAMLAGGEFVVTKDGQRIMEAVAPGLLGHLKQTQRPHFAAGGPVPGGAPVPGGGIPAVSVAAPAHAAAQAGSSAAAAAAAPLRQGMAGAGQAAMQTLAQAIHAHATQPVQATRTAAQQIAKEYQQRVGQQLPATTATAMHQVTQTVQHSKLVPVVHDQSAQVEHEWARLSAKVTDTAQTMTAHVSTEAHTTETRVSSATDKQRQEATDHYTQLKNAAGSAFDQMAAHVAQRSQSMTDTVSQKTASAASAGKTNIDRLEGSIYDALNAGVQVAAAGTKKIADDLNSALSAFGASKISVPSLASSAGGNPLKAATGGFIGAPGERGRDEVPIMVGRGEAVLNHPQQKVANEYLAPIGGLPGLYAATQGSLHHMASGGFAGYSLPLPRNEMLPGSWSIDQGVDIPAPAGTPEFAIGPGVIIGEGISGFGPNAPILHITAGPLAGQNVYYGHAGPDLVRVGQAVTAGQQISEVGAGIVGISTGPHIEIGFGPPFGHGDAMANTLRQLMSGAGVTGVGGPGGGLPTVAAPKVKGKGPVPDMVRAALKKEADAANAYIASHMPTMAGVAGAAGLDVSLSGPVAQQVYQFMSAAGFNKIAIAGMLGNASQESSMNPNAPGGGLWQQISNFGSGTGGSLLHQMQVMLPQIEGIKGQLNSAGSPGAAATIFEQSFERAGIPALGNRIAAANAAYAAGYAPGGFVGDRAHAGHVKAPKTPKGHKPTASKTPRVARSGATEKDLRQLAAAGGKVSLLESDIAKIMGGQSGSGQYTSLQSRFQAEEGQERYINPDGSLSPAGYAKKISDDKRLLGLLDHVLGDYQQEVPLVTKELARWLGKQSHAEKDLARNKKRLATNKITEASVHKAILDLQKPQKNVVGSLTDSIKGVHLQYGSRVHSAQDALHKFEDRGGIQEDALRGALLHAEQHAGGDATGKRLAQAVLAAERAKTGYKGSDKATRRSLAGQVADAENAYRGYRLSHPTKSPAVTHARGALDSFLLSEKGGRRQLHDALTQAHSDEFAAIQPLEVSLLDARRAQRDKKFKTATRVWKLKEQLATLTKQDATLNAQDSQLSQILAGGGGGGAQTVDGTVTGLEAVAQKLGFVKWGKEGRFMGIDTTNQGAVFDTQTSILQMQNDIGQARREQAGASSQDNSQMVSLLQQVNLQLSESLALSQAQTRALSSMIPQIPHYEQGGPVLKDTLAQVHEGEHVVPRGGALVVRDGGGGPPPEVHVHVHGDAQGLIKTIRSEIHRPENVRGISTLIGRRTSMLAHAPGR